MAFYDSNVYRPDNQSAMNYMAGGSSGNNPTGSNTMGGGNNMDPMTMMSLGQGAVQTISGIINGYYAQKDKEAEMARQAALDAQAQDNWNKSFNLSRTNSLFNQGQATQDMGLKGLNSLADQQYKAAKLQRFRDAVSAQGGAVPASIGGI